MAKLKLNQVLMNEAWQSKMQKPLAIIQPSIEDYKRFEFKLKDESFQRTRQGKVAKAFSDAIAKQGFYQINDPYDPHYAKFKKELQYLLEPKEIIFNRTGSNLFVFVEEQNLGIKVQYIDSDSSPEAWKLKKDQIVNVKNIYFERQAVSVAEDVKRVSNKLSTSICLAQMHGHWGYLPIFNADGEVTHTEIAEDDGVSTVKDIVRNMIANNLTVDATGYHNCFNIDHFKALSAIEEAVGIMKVPALELSAAVIKSDIFNGPHHMLWFADPDTAYEVQTKYLTPKTHPLPGESPDNVEYQRTLFLLQAYREQGKLAIGVAHPACSKGLGVAGLINTVALGYFTYDGAVENTLKYADAVAMFNPTLDSTPLKFKRDEDEKKVRELIEKHETGNVLSQNAINLAFAKEMSTQKYGLIPYFDWDGHNVNPMHYDPYVGKLGRGWNELNSGFVKSPADFVNYIRNRRPFKAVIFFELKEEKGVKTPEIISERCKNPFSDKISDMMDTAKEYALDTRDFIAGRLVTLKNWIKGIFKKKTN